jgi:aryl-phospho-beta-D-glucosidase BglC (GH1 family)
MKIKSKEVYIIIFLVITIIGLIVFLVVNNNDSINEIDIKEEDNQNKDNDDKKDDDNKKDNDDKKDDKEEPKKEDKLAFKNKDATVYVSNNVTLELNGINGNITCDSSDKIVAEVIKSNNSCIVTGHSYGNVTIKAKDNKNETSIKVSVINKKITSNDFLKVKGTKFVKVSNNDTVLLRGFNLGEFFSRAISLTPIKKASSNESAWDREYPDNNLQINYILDKRFGSEKAFTLNESYYSNFINEKDLDMIASSGANVVRLPIEWSYFVNLKFDDTSRDKNNNYKYSYTMLTGDKLESRFKHIDKIIDECGKRGIYVIIDLHVVDGGQNNGGIRSKRGGYSFFDNKDSLNNALAIWKLIAKRYKNNPIVAAYELLNEPGAPENKLISFYKDAYNTIRNEEKDAKYKHIIIMESTMSGATNHSIKSLKKPSEYGFSNVAYSVHDYFTSNNSVLPGNGSKEDVKKAIKAKVEQDVKEMKEYKIPLFIGETNFLWKDVDDVWKYAMSYYDSNLISYTFWTYKAAGSTSYGLVYNLDKNNSNKFADLLNDSYDTINKKFKMTTINGGYTLNKYYKVIRNNFAGNNGKSIMASSSYNCKVGEKIITSIKSFSSNGHTKLDKIDLSNNNVTINKISPTGVICDGTSCQTIEIICNKKGNTTLTITSNDQRITKSMINVN